MNNKQIAQIEERIGRIKQELQAIGEMRPGSLTRQYRKPKEKIGPYYQLSYMHKMKSHTDYVRPQFLQQIRSQISAYKRFKKLVEEWIELAIKHSKLTIDIAKRKEVK